MKKITLFIFLIFINLFIYAQEKVILAHAILPYDFIEISLEIENKPNDKFHLIKIDTITTVTNKDEILVNNNDVENIFRRANNLIRYQIPTKKYKTLKIKGFIKYFTPTEANKAYFVLDEVGKLPKNTNLIDKNIIKENPNLYFSIIDSTAINKIFPNFQLKINESDKSNKIDFKLYDLMYAYKSDSNQDFIPVVNDEIEFGYSNLTLKDRNTGIIYKLVKLKREMNEKERAAIKIELLIENKNSVKKIPFEFKDVTVREF